MPANLLNSHSPFRPLPPILQPLPFLRTSYTKPPRTPTVSRLRAKSDPPAPSSPMSILDGMGPISREERNRLARLEGTAKRRANYQTAKKDDEVIDLQTRCEEALVYLQDQDIKLVDLLFHVSDPGNKLADTQWKHLFSVPGRITQILTWWGSSSNSPTGRHDVRDWAVSHVSKIVSTEALHISQSGLLKNKALDLEAASRFSLPSLYKIFRDIYAPVTTKLIQAITTSPRQNREGLKEARTKQKEIVIASTITTCLAEYSQSNNIMKRLMGLYFYATGTARQTIGVLSKFRFSESYANIVAKGSRTTETSAMLPTSEPDPMSSEPDSTSSSDPVQAQPTSSDASSSVGTLPLASTTILSDVSSASDTPQKRKTPGTLQQLSDGARKEARKVAASGLTGCVYDNINFSDRIAEQVLGRTNTVESGTCATIWPLKDASLEDMKLEDYDASFAAAGSLKISDVLHTAEEKEFFRRCLRHCILRIIVAHGGDGFKAKFTKPLQDSLPRSDCLVSPAKTPLYPLPAWKINEATISGNADVVAAIVQELRLRNQPTVWMKHVRIMAGDQLSIARLRSLHQLRAGHEGGNTGFGWVIYMPGLFHAKIADMHGFFNTHWGKAGTGIRNPGNIGFHNTQLRRLPISPTSLPPFRTCRDLVFVSLYARVLHCLLLVSNHASLEAYLAAVDKWQDVEAHAEQILNLYADQRQVQLLREQREASEAAGTSTQPSGDMVFENAILFMRDALLSREFTDSIKAGDSGRVVLVLKMWALSFRGNGRTKYAYEMLALIHNLNQVWPKSVANIVLKNWLLNPTGRPNAFVEVDLVQEHMNFWIKTFYKAHGSNATWEWLEMISPCVTALRDLATSMKVNLGTDIGTKHQAPDLSRDIQVLMNSLAEHGVYAKTIGRKLDAEDPPVVDVIQAGLQSLVEGTALGEYNSAFAKLQKRRQMMPIYTEGDSPEAGSALTSTSDHPAPPSSPAPASGNTGEASSAEASPTQIASAGASANEMVEDSESDDDADSDVGEDGDLEAALKDDGPTLPRDRYEDVAFDMDVVEVDDDGEFEVEGDDDFM
ncbi:hypothetical protein DFP72DRAFT_859600 [Ephemerocybe angulata]|uniref:DUF6589 domain-containing protein n=1 Tax=Ephemerocybe angulata TaxID=980116 RepID=A0A8H6H9R0_9AGAR|nr:hypothetical protein DFP72DRAFT_859600 [Tulosesus angulatus]